MKKSAWPKILAGAMAVLALGFGVANWNQARQRESARQQMIASNVPPRAEFDTLLRRDLGQFFRQSSGRNLVVAPTLLSREPMLGELAQEKNLPQYFVWVRLLQNKKLLDEGVSRVYARGRNGFLVTGFESKTQLRKEALQLEAKFSPQVAAALSKYL